MTIIVFRYFGCATEFKESLLTAENGQGGFYDDLSSGLNPLISSRDKKSPSNYTSDLMDEDTGIELTALGLDPLSLSLSLPPCPFKSRKKKRG